MGKTFVSGISGKEFPASEKVPANAVRDSLMKYIRKDKPDFADDGCMSMGELNFYRDKYMSDYFRQEIGELSDIENQVLTSLKEHTSLTSQLDPEDGAAPLTLGQRVADRVATFGGSWAFILSFFVFIVLWMLLNVFVLVDRSYDPYPFILLNLLLSCLAALQAPVIMMSQNRQESKDRDRGKKDYMINLKSELEIRILHEKIDHLMLHQQQQLIEMQIEQMEVLNRIVGELRKSSPAVPD